MLNSAGAIGTTCFDAGDVYFRLKIQPHYMSNLMPDKTAEKKITVFHADYHALLRSGVKQGLARWPEIDICKEAGSGKELLKLLETDVPDIVVMNITLIGMDGLELLSSIKKNHPYLKVIVLTMHNDPVLIKKTMQLGANSFLSLNTNAETISQAILCVHEFNYYYSEAMEQAFLGPRPQFERIGREFTVKEQQILDLLAEDKSESEISKIMDISKRTVATVIENLNRRRHDKS
jgi:DNA-binding NarL/FixJ family response regulator